MVNQQGTLSLPTLTCPAHRPAHPSSLSLPFFLPLFLIPLCPFPSFPPRPAIHSSFSSSGFSGLLSVLLDLASSLNFTATELKEGKRFLPRIPGCQSFLPACHLTSLTLPSDQLVEFRHINSKFVHTSDPDAILRCRLSPFIGSPPLPTNTTPLVLQDDFALSTFAI